MNYEITLLHSRKFSHLKILESLVINMRSSDIRNLPGICLMVAGVHYICYA